MEILNLQQGSDEWKAVRLSHYTASEAPIMMGCSPYMSRDDLLTYKTTKVEAEITRFQQIIFDKGHELEAKARPITETKLGEDLYPVTGSIKFDGLPLLASFDGLTMMEDDGFEHKQWNQEKAENIDNSGDFEPLHYWQLEHQLLVSGMDSILFVMSDGTEDNWVELRYTSSLDRRRELIAGWKQFDTDLQDYEPQVYDEKPAPSPIQSLPKIEYQLNGLTIESNLDAYKNAAEKLVEDAKKQMETDQDFADRELLVKKFKEAELKIKAVQEQVVGEIKDVDKFCKDLGYIGEMIRQSRLVSEKGIKTQKDKIRFDIIKKSKEALQNFIDEINQDFTFDITLPAVHVDFSSAIKGKKTIKSLNESANDELARAKIEVKNKANLINQRISRYQDIARGYFFLFPDIVSIIHCESFIDIVHARIHDHKQAQEEDKNDKEDKDTESPKVDLSHAVKTTTSYRLKKNENNPLTYWANVHNVSNEALSELVEILDRDYGLKINITKVA